MKTAYDLGAEPTREEWSTYYRVMAYEAKETVAGWLECADAHVSQEDFEAMCHRYGKVDWHEDSSGVISFIYEDVVGA